MQEDCINVKPSSLSAVSGSEESDIWKLGILELTGRLCRDVLEIHTNMVIFFSKSITRKELGLVLQMFSFFS